MPARAGASTGLAAASSGGRLRSGGLEMVTIGPLPSQSGFWRTFGSGIPHQAPTKATASGTFSQNHTISIPPPGPGAPHGPRRPGSGPPLWLPAGNDQLPPGCPASPEGQSRSRHRGCLLADTPADGHPPRRRDPVPGLAVGDLELAGHWRAWCCSPGRSGPSGARSGPATLSLTGPDDRPFARMRRFGPPGVARLGLAL
jgi:hypothetical protein